MSCSHEPLYDCSNKSSTVCHLLSCVSDTATTASFTIDSLRVSDSDTAIDSLLASSQTTSACTASAEECVSSVSVHGLRVHEEH